MLARLDNDGPFQFFFTLSCADTRWDENFSAILHNKGYKITYEVTDEKHKTFVTCKDGNKMTIKEFLQNEVDSSLHEIIRQNVLTATRNYNYRLKKFIKEIVMGAGNPMCVSKYSAKVEFQHFSITGQSVQFLISCILPLPTTEKNWPFFNHLELKYMSIAISFKI